MINESDINWIVDNWNKISEDFKTSLVLEERHSHWEKDKMVVEPSTFKPKPKGLDEDENEAIFLLSRQKPSVEPSYDFDEERIGITNKGKIIWGFDSGCSCPSPWEDNYPDCYEITKTWKEFIIKDLTAFDGGYMEEMELELNKIRESI